MTPRKRVNVYRDGVRVAGAFTRDRALEHARRIARQRGPEPEVTRVDLPDGSGKIGYKGDGGFVFIYLPACALTMGCLCAAHARGRAEYAPCDASEDVKP